MAIEIDEFHAEIFQDVVTAADAQAQFVEDAFFELYCAHLVEAGELETADRAPYASARGLRIDGYGGDPQASEGVLSLIIADFRQDPAVGTLTATDMGAIFKRAFGFLQKALDPRFRDGLEESTAAFGLADLIATRWGITKKVRIILISNRTLSSRVDGHESGSFDERPVTYSVWDIGRLFRFVSAGRAREDIEIDLVRDFGGALSALPAHLEGADYAAYLAVVPGKVLAAIYDRWGPRLLEQNVRVFLQARGKVNKGIRITLDNEPGMFFAYNNGITATAESVEYVKKGGSIEIRSMKNMQIVNGGQTTASIYAASKRNGNLSDVFVQMKLSVIEPAQAVEVVPRISEYANSQNRVNAADFFANHPFHIRVEGFSRRIYAPSPDGSYRESKWFYERARGQYQDARGDLTTAQRRKFDLEYPKKQMFAKTDLAKYVMLWVGEPHTVSMGAQKNFASFALAVGKEWRGEAAGFNNRYYRHAIAKAIVFKRAEKLVSEQPWYQGGYRANIVAYAIAKIGHDVAAMGKSFDFDGVWREQAPSKAMERAMAIAAKNVYAVLVNPPSGISNVTEWAKKASCWERVKALKIVWPADWQKELLTPQAERKKEVVARREQKEWTEIEAQAAAVEAGREFWREVIAWGSSNRQLSPDELSVLGVAASMPARVPSGKQSLWAIRILERLQAEGCPLKFGT